MSHIEHTDYYSNILGISLKVEVTGHYGHPVIMFPTSQGQYTQNHDFHLNGSINWFVEQGKVKLYNIETIDSWSFYDNTISPQQRIRNYERYVQFLIKEFVPYIQKLHKTHRGRCRSKLWRISCCQLCFQVSGCGFSFILSFGRFQHKKFYGWIFRRPCLF